MPSKKKLAQYVVANPRGIPPGRHILRVGDRVWFEGDPYDGPVTVRFVEQGFLVEAGKED